jgi:hypothetical protein
MRTVEVCRNRTRRCWQKQVKGAETKHEQDGSQRAARAWRLDSVVDVRFDCDMLMHLLKSSLQTFIPTVR